MKKYEKDYILEENDELIIEWQSISWIEYRQYIVNWITIFQANIKKNKIAIFNDDKNTVHTIFQIINWKEEKVFSITGPNK